MEKKIKIELDYTDFDAIKYVIELDESAKTIEDMAKPFAKVIMNNENLYKIIRVAMQEVDLIQDLIIIKRNKNKKVKY